MKSDICYCKDCNHPKATICISYLCGCCLEADRIRFEHPVYEQNEDEARKERENEQRKEVDAMNIFWK